MRAGAVGHRDLRVAPVAAEANPRGVDVVLLDPAELALVFGQIAPGKVAAPNSALSVRLISAFTDEQLAPSGLTNADVAYAAARQILAVGGNVLSVDTGADDDDPPGEHTVIEVADETLVAGTEGADELFGPIDVQRRRRPHRRGRRRHPPRHRLPAAARRRRAADAVGARRGQHRPGARDLRPGDHR